VDYSTEILGIVSRLLFDLLEESFQKNKKVSLECVVKLCQTIYSTYGLDDIKRKQPINGEYDIGHILVIGIQQCLTLAIRKPNCTMLKLDDNIKGLYSVLRAEGATNIQLDLNTIYLSTMVFQFRAKILEQKSVILQTVDSECHKFLKGFMNYFIYLEFDINEMMEMSETRQFFLEEMIQSQVFEPLMRLDYTAVAACDDYLESVFVWESFQGIIEAEELNILRFILIIRLYQQVIGTIQDALDMSKLIYKNMTLKSIPKIIHDNFVKCCLKIYRVVRLSQWGPFTASIAPKNPNTVGYMKAGILNCLNGIRRICEENIYFSIILYNSQKEFLEITESSSQKIVSSSLVTKLEPQKMKLHKEMLEQLAEVTKELNKL
jgi:hypothetical protein